MSTMRIGDPLRPSREGPKYLISCLALSIHHRRTGSCVTWNATPTAVSEACEKNHQSPNLGVPVDGAVSQALPKGSSAKRDRRSRCTVLMWEISWHISW